jgi:hypothetical protein
VHDAVLIEAPIERIEADVALMQEIMRRASRVVLGAHELRTDAKIIRYPDRYTDRSPRRRRLGQCSTATGRVPATARGAMRNGKARNLSEEEAEEAEFARLQQRDAEIEADFQRAVAATKTAGKARRGQRHMGAPWSFWVALRERGLPWLAVILAVYVYRRARVTGSNTVTLVGAELEELKIDRYQRSRALRRLVAAGVIRMRRIGTGRSLRVTLLLR